MEIIKGLVDLRVSGNFDPANSEHAQLLTETMNELNYCADTMALLLEAMGQRNKEKHNKTYDVLSGS